MNKVIRINLNEKTITSETVPDQYARLGGRALTSNLLYDEVSSGIDALGPNNKLVMAPGLLGGTGISSSGRLSVGSKSPLTGTIKEANAGGTAGSYLAAQGIRALVIEGAAPQGSWYILHIGGKYEFKLLEINQKSDGVYSFMQEMRHQWGDQISIICIGPAGIQRMRSASVVVSDPEFETRFAARGGLGAVMGAKGLLGVIIEAPERSHRQAANREKHLAVVKKFNRMLLENPKTGKNLRLYGTSAILKVVNEIGCLPTRNFSSGSFEAADKISGEALHELINQRGGEGRYGKRCMPGCVINCSNIFPGADGKAIVSTLQYETIGLLGSNCGFSSLDDVARLNYLCNDIGMDTIEIGAALGVAMDGGIIKFGDLDAAENLLEEIRRGTPLGKVIGNGALITGTVFAVKRIPVCKSQAFPAYDPRALKANGVTYATSPMGADHTAGNSFGDRNRNDPLKPQGQVELSRELQVKAAVLDAIGLCIFARPPIFDSPELAVEMLNSLYGWDLNENELWDMGRDLLKVEWAFNEREGFTPLCDYLPEIFNYEQLPPHNTVFDVSQAELSRLRDF